LLSSIIFDLGSGSGRFKNSKIENLSFWHHFVEILHPQLFGHNGLGHPFFQIVT